VAGDGGDDRSDDRDVRDLGRLTAAIGRRL
jgi:hypothetical protein